MFKLKYHYNNYLIKKYEKKNVAKMSSADSAFFKDFYEISLKESENYHDKLLAQESYLKFLRGKIQ